MRTSREIHKNDFFREYTTTISIDNQFFTRKKSVLYPILKRTIDLLVSVIGLLLSIPIIILIGIAIKLESSGPVFYIQDRVGLNGKYFKIYKFRSMYIDAEKNGAKWAEKNDPRITKVGSFIRKTRIDELPQFWNVFVGDMSLIGPRPERPIFTAQFNKEIPGFINRLKVKPGITGWAQVNGGYELTPKEKLELDIYYINNMNLWLDFKIMLKTITVILTGEGSR